MAAIRSKCSSVLKSGLNSLEYLFCPMRAWVGVKKIGSMTFTYGRCKQEDLIGKYAGVQCTTMALTAIIQNLRNTQITPKKINKILKEGNRLHARLREDLNLSNNSDERIAIDDFPHDAYVDLGMVFGDHISVKLMEKCSYVFPLKKQGFEDFLTVKEYLELWKENIDCRGFLITLQEYSYSIIFDNNGEIKLFDSHGHLEFNDKVIKEKAGVLKFKNMDDFESFIVNMYEPEESAAIAPVAINVTSEAVNIASEAVTIAYEAVKIASKSVNISSEALIISSEAVNIALKSVNIASKAVIASVAVNVKDNAIHEIVSSTDVNSIEDTSANTSSP